MNLTSKAAFQAGISDKELADHVWRAIMDSDSIGKKRGGPTAGPTEGVMRWRNSYWCGWNTSTVPHASTLGNAVRAALSTGTRTERPTPSSLPRVWQAPDQVMSR